MSDEEKINLEIRKKITDILNQPFNSNGYSKIEVDKQNQKILSQLEEIDGINVDLGCEQSRGYKLPLLMLVVPIINVNAYPYALNLASSERYKETVTRCYQKYRYQNVDITKYTASSFFVEYLLDSHYLNKMPSPEDNCLVIYFQDDNNTSSVRHAGIMECDSKVIRSKWGEFEAIIRHKLWNVPTNYGNHVKYYKSLDKDRAEEYFSRYIETNDIKTY